MCTGEGNSIGDPKELGVILFLVGMAQIVTTPTTLPSRIIETSKVEPFWEKLAEH